MTLLKKQLTLAALTLAFSSTLSQDSQAAMFLTFSESGNDVILNVSGSLSLEGLNNEQSNNINLGAADQLNSVNQQLQIGAGANVALNKWTLSVINTPFAAVSNINGTVDLWDAANNAQAMRYQQNNGQIAVDDAFGDGVNDLGLIVNITSQHTFANQTLADFGLTAGTSVVWLENESSVISGDDGKIFVVAVPEPSSLALLGLGGLLIARRRRG
jgi:hypothetical protein